MKAMKTSVVLFILPHVQRSILIMGFTLVKTHFENMTIKAYKIFLDRNR